MTRIERSEIRSWVGWRCVGKVLGGCGDVGGCWGACVGRAWGVRGACVGRVWGGAIRVGIARSALLSGYLGKSGHLPRY